MRRDHFERFEDHTRLKHFLLDSYLKGWATILVRGLRRSGSEGPRLWVVDAFAGAGRDDSGAPGSPVIAAEIAAQINAKHFATPLRLREGMRVVAFEVDRRRYERLVQNLAPYMAPPAVAIARFGTLQERMEALLQYIGLDPTFFFLDPFGVDGLDAALLPRLLEGPRAEILVLFSDEGAARLAGKADAVVPTREELLSQRQSGPSLLGAGFDAELEAFDRLSVDRVLAGHASNPRAAEILNRAFGGDWWQDVIADTPQPQRQAKFVQLYETVLRSAGATYVLPFDVTTEEGRHKYTLLHASKHKRAFAAMKEAMHRARAQRTPEEAPSLFAEEPVNEPSITLDSGANLDEVADQVARHFAGREVRWTIGGYTEDSVRAYARDETPLLIHEFEQLQRALARRGYVASPTPLTYLFPTEE